MLRWQQTTSIPPVDFVCGYCGKHVGPNVGYYALIYYGENPTGQQAFVYICSFCSQPTYFRGTGNERRQTPGPMVGTSVDNLPDTIKTLYNEARAAISADASTCAVMGLRTLLAHVAVERGADENQAFTYYVTWLSDHHYVPPGSEGWVDHIRKMGNVAIHDLQIMDPTQAQELLAFSEMILRLVYDYPARVLPPTTSPPTTTT